MTLQDFIHYAEVGAGKRYIRILLVCVAVLVVAVGYDFRLWKNFSAPEAMDSAQLARNIAEGKGYTTLFIRPLSLYLVQENNQAKTASPDAGADPARVKTAHPDLANPPVYPLALAGLMKILPFHNAVNLKSAFWSNNNVFWRYQPDFMIGVFNEVLFLAAIAATFFIAKKIFATDIAWVVTILMLGSDLLWRFSASGLSTMLLLLFFLGLIWCVLKIEEIARDPQPDAARILCWVAAAGVMTGIGTLTRYSFGWTIIPVILFAILFGGSKKFSNGLAAFAAFAIILTPWIVRNIAISGTPFGTAGFAIFDETTLSSGFPIERSLHPDFSEALAPGLYWHKFIANIRPILENDLLKLGGSLISVLFLAGLLLAFNRTSVRRMRYFLLMCLGVFIVVQSLGRTWLSDESPEINSENLFVLLTPLVFIFGTAFFFILLDQMRLSTVELPIGLTLRRIVIGIFIVVCCFPLLSERWFKGSPVSYPPYYPPDIEKAAAWMKEDELTMSDVPWAVAWYGQRQSAWITDDAGDDFFSLNDYIKPVNALFLTFRTMDDKLISGCLAGGKNGWPHFALDTITQTKVPTNFPLRHWPAGSAGMVARELFLTDADRWKINKDPGQ
jgi:hypothetical protein